MKKGDIVIIKESYGEFFQVGDKARLIGYDPYDGECWEGDFNNMGNLEVKRPGKWWFDAAEVEVYEEQDPEEVLP